MNVYPFIDAEKRPGSDGIVAATPSVSRELLEASRSAYYGDAVNQVAVITAETIRFHDDSGGTYESPRVHADLVEAGLQHSLKRAARLMREPGSRQDSASTGRHHSRRSGRTLARI